MPPWLQSGAAVSWRYLVMLVAAGTIVYAVTYLHVIMLPIFVALLATTFLLPPDRWLRRRGLPDAAAAAAVMLGGALVLAGIGAAIAPSIGGQFTDLGDGVRDGVRQVTDVLAERPFGLTEAELRERVDQGLDRLQENSSSLSGGVLTGAILVGEIITGLIVTILLTFFFLKDGEQMWAWLLRLVPGARRGTVHEGGGRALRALAGYIRGIAAVGFVDAVLIGIALLILGVPLVVPLMLLTFFGAFVPLIGAFLAGLAAVLIALVAKGVVAALIILGVIILVQQIEGHVLYPFLMSRSVHLHPAVVVIALGIGAVLGGIVGVFLAVPVAGVIAVLLDYAREHADDDAVAADAEAEPDPPDSALNAPDGSADPATSSPGR